MCLVLKQDLSGPDSYGCGLLVMLISTTMHWTLGDFHKRRNRDILTQRRLRHRQLAFPCGAHTQIILCSCESELEKIANSTKNTSTQEGWEEEEGPPTGKG